VRRSQRRKSPKPRGAGSAAPNFDGTLNSLPLVTVLIPAYNAERTIRRALDSVFAQKYANLEILIVDDASKDGTARVVESYAKDKIRLLKLPRNLGECGAMNEGLAAARGEYVAFLDADDEWLPTKLAKQIARLEQNPRACFASCGCRFVYSNKQPDRMFGLQPQGLAKSEIWRGLLAKSFIAKPCVVARTACLRQVGPFDTTLAVGGDQDMWIRLSLIGEVEFVKEHLTIVYDTPRSLTKTYARRAADFVLPMIERHIERQRTALSRAELRAIYGERYTYLGRNLYLSGNVLRGARFILRAIGTGTRVRENAWYLVTASPLARTAKRIIMTP
jgi:glycosyltransferase involved in cell wall biosynthesis